MLFAPAFIIILDVFIVNVTAPSLKADLGASDSDVQLVVAAYVMSYAISLITGGRLGDIYGRRRLFQFGVAGFTVASAICAAAPNPTVLILGRLAQGFAGAAMWPQVLSIVQVEFPPHERQRALSLQSGTQALASIAGQIVGGFLIALDPLGLEWRSVFLINIPIGLLTLLAAPVVIRESRSASARQLDLQGVALASLALALALVPAIEGRELGWPPWAFVSMAASIPVALLFAVKERQLSRRGGSPLVEPKLFEQPGFRLGITSVLILFGVFSFFLWFSIYLQEGLGVSALDSGLSYTPLAVVSATFSLTVPKYFKRYADYLPQTGALLAAFGLVATMLVAANTESFTIWLIVATLPIGAGMGLAMPTLIRLVLHTVPSGDAGAAAGLLSTAQQVGNAVGVAAIGAVFFSIIGSQTDAGSYSDAFAVTAGVQAVVALGAAWMLSRTRREELLLRELEGA